MTALRAGAAEAVITPPAAGTLLIGPTDYSTGVHDDLFARALVLDDGRERAAIVTMDLCGLDFALADELRAEVEKRAGVPRGAVMLNCSHTHNAPFTVPWSVVGWQAFQRDGQQWRRELVENVAGAVELAVSSLREATIRSGREHVQVGLNRRLPTESGIVMRPNPEGAVVPWADVLRVDGPEGKPAAVLLSHAAHPVIVHGASTLMSADYPGYAVRAVRRLLGEGVLAMFAQGCGANINGEPLRGGFDEARRAGTILGTAAAKAAIESEPLAPGNLRVRSVLLDLPFQKAPPLDQCECALDAAEEELARMQASGADERSSWYARDGALACRELVETARQDVRRSLRFEMQALAVGDGLCILAMTHEVFAEYQLWTDRVSPFLRTMVLGYTNGCESYIPCERDFGLGGYEAAAPPAPCAALRYRNRLALEPHVERQIKQALANCLNTLAIGGAA